MVGTRLLLLLLLVPLSCRGQAGDRPVQAEGSPIVLISVDTLRSDRLSAYGATSVATPHLDALAADSVLFERAYSHCPLTLPSHATLFTGLLPPEHGVRNNRGYFLAERFEVLAERLRKAGYRTGAAVSSMVLARATGIAQGFDAYEEPGGASGQGGQVFAQQPGEVALERARRWLAGVGRGERFFYFLHLFEPHSPYQAPEPHASRHAHPYDAEVAHADELVGAFLSDLRARDLYDGSVIVFLSDHGEGLGDHVEHEHGVFLYRESLQVPLMVKLPGQQRRGERVREVAGLLDVLPTVLALAGLDRGTLPGHPLFEAPPPPRRALYAESVFGREQYGWSELRSAIQDDLHYIEAPRPELYDLARDPQERHNLLPGRAAPAALRRVARSGGEGARSTRAISSEQAERLAALGYVGGPEEDAAGDATRPDPKDHIARAMELWSLMQQLERTESVEPEARILALLEEMGLRRENLRRTVATNLLRAGRAAAAARSLEAFEESSHPETQVLLGEIATARGRFGEARSRLRRALDLDPGSPRARRDLGILLLTQGRPAEARRWLEEALGRDPHQAEAWTALGVVRAQAGDPAGAVEAWQRAVEIDPQARDAWFNLAVALEKEGDRPRAAAALERYIPLATGVDRDRALAQLRRLRPGA